MTIYYNVQFVTDYGMAVTYHSVSRLDAAINYILSNFSAVKIFVYRLPNQYAKRGHYAGYYHFKNQSIVWK